MIFKKYARKPNESSGFSTEGDSSISSDDYELKRPHNSSSETI